MNKRAGGVINPSVLASARQCGVQRLQGAALRISRSRIGGRRYESVLRLGAL